MVCMVAFTFYAQAEEVECPEDSGEGDEAILIPHPTNCKHYFVCDHGRAIVMKCPEGLHFNPVEKVCDFPATAGCKIKS